MAIVAKTDKENPKIPGTIYTAAAAVEKAGGKAIAIKCDIRDEKSVEEAVKKTVKAFGGIDILINNASAISLTNMDDTPMKRFDLMNQINSRGTYLCAKACIPYLKKSKNPHILTLSPPLNIFEDGANWFKGHIAYTLAKYGMTLITFGLSEELKPFGVGCNTLWPRTAIATAAVKNLLGGDSSVRKSRTPDIMADSAYEILTADAGCTNGQYFLDDHVLASVGVDDLRKYKVDPTVPDEDLMPDFFC